MGASTNRARGSCTKATAVGAGVAVGKGVVNAATYPFTSNDEKR